MRSLDQILAERKTQREKAAQEMQEAELHKEEEAIASFQQRIQTLLSPDLYAALAPCSFVCKGKDYGTALTLYMRVHMIFTLNGEQWEIFYSSSEDEFVCLNPLGVSLSLRGTNIALNETELIDAFIDWQEGKEQFPF